MKRILLATACTLMLSTPAFAQSGLLDGWTGEASLTGSKTTGNTDTQDLGLGLKLNKAGAKWRHKFNALADFGEVDGDKNKERYSFGYQIDRDVSDKLYVYGNADYFKDEFGAFRDGYFLGTGLGYKMIVPDPIGWNLEGGLGYRSQREQLPSTGESNELAVRGFSDFDFAVNEAVSLFNDTEIIWSDSDTYIWNEVGLTANLAGNLAARASFRVDNHSNVPVGTKKTDTITRFGIVYTMK